MTYLTVLVQRERGETAAAKALLLVCKRTATCRKDGDYPKTRYLLGEISPSVLFADAKTDMERVDRHAVVGLSLLQRGDAQGARSHFVWAVAHAKPGDIWLPILRQRLSGKK